MNAPSFCKFCAKLKTIRLCQNNLLLSAKMSSPNHSKKILSLPIIFNTQILILDPASPMSRKLIFTLLYILLFLWQLPQNLVALAMLPFIGKPRVVARRNYCIGMVGRWFPDNASGVSLGNFAFFHPDCIHDNFTIRHEMDGHAVDSRIFGPLYLFIIGVPSLLHFFFMKKGSDYYDFYTERRANRFAKIMPPNQKSTK